MARTVDEAAHGQRRDAFIDAMERLLRGKGFQAVTIADVLSETGASKGAFYHYFDSKTALLYGMQQRLLDRMAAATEPVLASIDPAMAKLDGVIEVLASWKSANREVLLAAGRAWYGDENALPRERLRKIGIEWMTTMLAQIIRQGHDEGVFAAPDPDTTARLVVVTLQDLQEYLVEWVIGRHPDAGELTVIHNRVAGYHRAMERLLGAAPNTIHIVPETVLDEWFANLTSTSISGPEEGR